MAATITSAHRLLPRIFLLPYRQRHELSCNSRCLGRYASSMTVTAAGNEKDDFPKDRRLDFDAASLSARGYLRNQNPYTPPRDVETKILRMCEKHMGKQTAFLDATMKFKVLTLCSQSLHHNVPNSLIHKITNIEELMAFYKMPVDTTVPLDMMKDMDLPRNLHVIYKYHRFNPETDDKFGGVTVFTKDSTIVSGLKYKKKYPAFVNKSSWPYK